MPQDRSSPDHQLGAALRIDSPSLSGGESSSLPLSNTQRALAPRERLLPLAGVVSLHLACYWIVTRVTLARGPDVLFDTTIGLDRLIPHIPATWPFYWIAYPFVVLAGGGALLRMPSPRYRRALVTLVAMTLAGALIQLVVPARAPWPTFPAPMQARFHQSAWILPYATLPSMHVAYCLFAATLVSSLTPTRAIRGAAALVVVLVAIATLTLKEHVLLDVITGVALGALGARWWFLGRA